MKIEELWKNLEEAGFYKKEDIKEICEIEKAYLEECEEIAEECGKKAILHTAVTMN